MRRHDHDPGTSPEDQSIQKLGLVAAINLAGFVLGGLLFGSVALLGDALHMLFDALSYIVALGATWIAQQSDSSGQ